MSLSSKTSVPADKWFQSHHMSRLFKDRVKGGHRLALTFLTCLSYIKRYPYSLLTVAILDKKLSQREQDTRQSKRQTRSEKEGERIKWVGKKYLENDLIEGSFPPFSKGPWCRQKHLVVWIISSLNPVQSVASINIFKLQCFKLLLRLTTIFDCGRVSIYTHSKTVIYLCYS